MERIFMEEKIENKIERIVTIKEINTSSKENPKLYLMSIAKNEIRGYLSKKESSRIAGFMKRVVLAIATSREKDPHKLVKIEELTTYKGTYYALSIAGISMRTFIDGYEAEVMQNFMVSVVSDIIAMLGQ
jgi:hypothetical protein